MAHRHALTLFFVLSCVISWAIWAPLWLVRFGVQGLPQLPYHHAYGALGPIGAAFIVSALDSGRAGPLDLLRRMVLWHGRLAWVAVGLAAPFAVLLLAVLAAWLFAGETISLAAVGVSREFPQLSLLGLLVYNVLSFGYGEETGWRGFALPRLQTRHSAFVATAILTVGWAVWHIPLFLYRPGYSHMGPAEGLGWFFSLLTGAVLLTWLYNSSRGSILVVALFHASVDIVFTSDISSEFVVNASGALITMAGIVVLLALGPRHLSRTGKVIREAGAGSAGLFVARN